MANILLIDDEPVLLNLIASILRLDNHDVSAMRGPLAALASLDDGQTPFDLLLTDIEMKPISGFELVQRLAKTGFSSPVLFMSGYPALAEAVSQRLGDHAILEKPFTAAQLRAAVSKALQKARGQSPRAA